MFIDCGDGCCIVLFLGIGVRAVSLCTSCAHFINWIRGVCYCALLDLAEIWGIGGSKSGGL